MTVMAERTSSQMSVDVFERIAEFAEREDETVRLEFIDGRIGLRKVTNGNHSTIIMWLIRQCMQARPELDLDPTQGVEKPRGYAAAGVPVHLLIDREHASVVVHSKPDPEDGYRDIHTVKIGDMVTLPEPVGITLDTDQLKPYLD